MRGKPIPSGDIDPNLIRCWFFLSLVEENAILDILESTVLFHDPFLPMITAILLGK